MLLRQTEELLCQLFLTISREEQNIEVARQILCEQSDFEPYTAFKRIDRIDSGVITIDGLYEYMISNGVEVTYSDCECLIRSVDTNDDRQLSYENLVRLLVTRDQLSLARLVGFRRTYEVSSTQLLNNDVEFAIARVLERQIIALKSVQQVKNKIMARPDVRSEKDLFTAIDMYSSQSINEQNLTAFFKKHGYEVNPRELTYALRFIDKYQDNLVTLSTFLEFMSWTDPSSFLVKNTGMFNNASVKLSSYQDSQQNPGIFYKLNSDENKQPVILGNILVNQRTTQSIARHIQSQGKNKRITTQNDKKHTSKGSVQILKLEDKITAELGELARTLKQFISLEKELEIARQELTSRVDFDALQAFRMIDFDGKGTLAFNEFSSFLKQLGLTPPKHELFLVIKRYANESDGFVGFPNFLDMVTPLSNGRKTSYNYSTGQEGEFDVYQGFQPSRALGKKPTGFSQSTSAAFVQLLVKLLENETAAEALRQRLYLRKHFDLKRLFFMILNSSDADCIAQMTGKRGVVDVDSLIKLLENQGIQIPHNDYLYLLARLDKNKDGYVSLAEFLSELSPKSPKQFC